MKAKTVPTKTQARVFPAITYACRTPIKQKPKTVYDASAQLVGSLIFPWDVIIPVGVGSTATCAIVGEGEGS